MFRISRPRFRHYVFGPYLIGYLLGAIYLARESGIYWEALGSQLSFLFVLGPVVPLTIYFLYPANLLIYGVNDVFDYETDKLNDKKGNYEEKADKSRHKSIIKHIVAWHIPFILLYTIFFILFPPSWEFGIAFVGSIVAFWFFGIFYSAPPIRAKAIPFLDGIFNILYIIPGITAYVVVLGSAATINRAYVLAATMRAMAMHCYSAVPDIEADRAAGITTTAVYLGKNGALSYCAVLRAGAAAITYQALVLLSIIGGLIYLVMVLLSLREKDIFGLYRAFPYINMLLGFALFWRLVYININVPTT